MKPKLSQNFIAHQFGGEKANPAGDQTKPIGSERTDKRGLVLVKLAHHVWQYKHIAIWEAAHGKKPKGHRIIFADGNKRNFSLDNLILVTAAEALQLYHFKLGGTTKETTLAGLEIVRLMMARTKAKERLKKQKGAGKIGRPRKNDRLA